VGIVQGSQERARCILLVWSPKKCTGVTNLEALLDHNGELKSIGSLVQALENASKL
jgi:hypothetical protein